MNSFFKPLFSISSRKYSYNLPFDTVRTQIEDVFVESRNLFSSTDIYACFTAGDSFEMVSASSAASNGIRYQSILIGTLQKDVENKTVILTNTRPAISFKFIFWICLSIFFICLIQGILLTSARYVLYGIAIGAIGSFLSIKLADISSASVEERYQLFIDKHLNSL